MIARVVARAERRRAFGIVSGRHLRKFLTAFRYGDPALRAVAIDVRFWVQPTGVIKGTGFDKSKFRHDRHVGGDRRSTLGTKIPTNRLAAVAGVIERLKPSLNGYCGLRDAHHDRESGTGLQ